MISKLNFQNIFSIKLSFSAIFGWNISYWNCSSRATDSLTPVRSFRFLTSLRWFPVVLWNSWSALLILLSNCWFERQRQSTQTETDQNLQCRLVQNAQFHSFSPEQRLDWLFFIATPIIYWVHIIQCVLSALSPQWASRGNILCFTVLYLCKHGWLWVVISQPSHSDQVAILICIKVP